MEQRREIANAYAHKGLGLNIALAIVGIKRSTFYYKPNGRARGKPCSTHTKKLNGELVHNDKVLELILKTLSNEYHDYGYQVMSVELKKQGYIINEKKVYRLMGENHLLHASVKSSKRPKRERINYTVPPLTEPFSTVEADLKYIYIHGQNRNAYLLTMLCTFCRLAPVWRLNFTMKSADVNELLESMLQNMIVKRYTNSRALKIRIRTDNGPQFIAHALASELKSKQIAHEFIHLATPQENAHIESFHNTVTRLVTNKNVFHSLDHAKQVFTEFFNAYNNTRVMKSLLYYSPSQFLCLWDKGIVGIKRDHQRKEIFFFKEKPHPNPDDGSSPEEVFVQNKFNTFSNQFVNRPENSPN